MPIKNEEQKYKQITEMGRKNDYTTGNLLDYEYFSKHYKLIEIDLTEQIELENPDLKQQINFIGRLEDDNATMFFYHWKGRRKNSWIFTKWRNNCLSFFVTYNNGNTKKCKFIWWWG